MHRLEARFRDCDPLGHVNNAVYLTYLEQARFAFWRKVRRQGFDGRAGIIMARAEIDYRSPAVAGDELEVRVGIGEVRRSSFVLTYTIVEAPSRRLVAEAQTVIVTYDYESSRSIPIPDDVRAALLDLQSLQSTI